MTRLATHYGTPDTLVDAHTVYAAAALTGLLANPNIMHDTDKTTTLAHRYAERMANKDGGNAR